MDDTTKQLLMGLARHAITTGAGALVTYGLIHSNQVDDVSSAALLLLGIAWSAWQKYGQAKAMAMLKVPAPKP